MTHYCRNGRLLGAFTAAATYSAISTRGSHHLFIDSFSRLIRKQVPYEQAGR